jgi:hypothetical protein
VAEAFAQFRVWSAGMFAGPPGFPGSRRRLATFAMDPARCLDLDDPQVLSTWGMRPSEVVTRQRRVTRAWALRIFQSGAYDGVTWWSYHNPDWTAHGLWNQSGITLVEVEDLHPEHDAVAKARAHLMRTWR